MIVLISDCLNPPYDEGFKNIAYRIVRRVSEIRDVVIIGSGRNSKASKCMGRMGLGKKFFDPAVIRAIKESRPAIIWYIPSSSLTLFSFVRSRILKFIAPQAKIVVFGLQARHYSKVVRNTLKLLKVDGLVVLSKTMKKEVDGLSSWTEVFTPGVDLQRFSPADEDEKDALRKRYSIPQKSFVVLHVGHLKTSRNLETVVDALKDKEAVFCVVSSSTTAKEKDTELRDRLGRKGVMIFEGTLKNIEELYKLSDCYVFPVLERTGATEMPLSVLEAMASNIPVLTTPYGTLPEVFDENRKNGFYYVRGMEAFKDGISAVRKTPKANLRRMVASYSWVDCVDHLVERIDKRIEACWSG